MIIDLIYVVLLLLAVIKGFQRGLIIGVFSFLSIIIGLAAAMKLSTVVAGYLGDAVNISDQWLPVISFAVVFIAVVLLVRWGANALEKTIEIALLGWLNKIGGIILYAAIYTTVFSILIFYLEQMGVIKPETINKSVTYSFIQPWGPEAIGALGTIVPWFKGMFAELQDFFGNLSGDMPPAK